MNVLNAVAQFERDLLIERTQSGIERAKADGKPTPDISCIRLLKMTDQRVKRNIQMKIGYARVSTRDQNPALQVDALKAAGCERIYQDVASGVKTARPALDELLSQLRAGDVMVIWKLDRMGRSLKHLVELVGNLMERKVGLLSLNDPIDTTSAQGRFLFNLFATLAEFERELIRERTQAGLTPVHAAGYLRHRNVEIGPYKTSVQQSSSASVVEGGSVDQPKVATILLTLRIATTDNRHKLPAVPNLLDRQFEPSRPDEVWLYEP
eukprot:scaffold31.g3772.t1